MSRVKNVTIFPNGNIVVFDEKGQRLALAHNRMEEEVSATRLLARSTQLVLSIPCSQPQESEGRVSSRVMWMKPYSRIEEGMSPNSLIGFYKHPYAYEYLPETEDEDGKNYPTTTQWAYTLFIDAWVVKLRFDWLGKVRGE